MNLPAWLDGELAAVAERNTAREITRAQAVTQIRDAIRDKGDRALIDGILSAFAARALDSWQRRNRGDGTTVLAAQSGLFPDLPARLYIRPGQAKAVILFTGHDWDTARAVLENRTTGAIKGAEQDWAAFDAAYQQVRPLLSGDLTTADVAFELANPGEAAAT